MVALESSSLGRGEDVSDPLPTDPKEHPTVCGWQRDEDGNDHTDCGGTWCLDDGTPPENDMKFCPYCGKLIGWCDYVPEEEDDDE